jgi:hypothetical protein
MTDRDDTRPHDVPGDGDPLLVRPFLDAGQDPPSGQRWPAEKYRTIRSHRAGRSAAPAGAPAGPAIAVAAAGATSVSAGRATAAGRGSEVSAGPASAVPARTAVEGVPPESRGRRLLTLAGAGAAAALGLVALGYALVPPGPDAEEGQLPAGALPPPVSVPAPVTEPGATAPGTRPGAPPPGRSTGPAAPAAGTTGPDGAPAAGVPGQSGALGETGVPGGSVAPEAPGSTAPTGLPPALVPPTVEPTLAEVPEVARVGRIAATGSLCLDVDGGAATATNDVQVFNCNGTDAQRWTLAPDGTLQAVGRCAQVTGGDSVHIVGCAGGDEAQWRVGEDDSLVNLATNQCLTDPADGSRSGADVTVEACTGTANQEWDLP